MEVTRCSTGSDVLDKLIGGGFETDVVTTVYGPSGSGKSNICIVSAAKTARAGKRVIYIDSEGGFSVERLKQIDSGYKELLDSIILLKPTRFEEQKATFEKLIKLIEQSPDGEVGMIIIDTISMLYRLELGKSEDVYTVNRELGRQISTLTEIARKRNIPVLIANQVYAKFDERDKISMVGGDILKYGSKCLIELQKGHGGLRKAVLKKHRALPEDKEILFEIVNEGIVPVADSVDAEFIVR